MNETIIVALIGGGLVTGTIELIKWFNSRRSRDAGLVTDYLKIADMSGEQLERKVNQINVLEAQIEALRAQIASLQAQITAAQIDSNTRQTENERVIEALKDYIKVLIDELRRHDMDIPPRPDILKESNPKIKAVK